MSTANRKKMKLPGTDSSSLEANSKLYDASSSFVNMIETNRIIMRDGFQYFEIE